MLEGRNFIGIEKNEDVALFKRDEIDYIEVAESRLRNAWLSMPGSEREQLYVSPLIAEFTEEN
jgi:site-specific DNA-methyltransferase (adenine-specific)/modification methylase